MRTFQYTGIVTSKKEILELRGVYKSRSIESAIIELTACGLKIIDIREATLADIKIDRYKKFREALQGKPKPKLETISIKEKSILERILDWIFKTSLSRILIK